MRIIPASGFVCACVCVCVRARVRACVRALMWELEEITYRRASFRPLYSTPIKHLAPALSPRKSLASPPAQANSCTSKGVIIHTHTPERESGKRERAQERERERASEIANTPQHFQSLQGEGQQDADGSCGNCHASHHRGNCQASQSSPTLNLACRRRNHPLMDDQLTTTARPIQRGAPCSRISPSPDQQLQA